MKISGQGLLFGIVLSLSVFVTFFLSGCGPSYGRAEVLGDTYFNYDDNNIVLVYNNVFDTVVKVRGVEIPTGKKAAFPLGYHGKNGGSVELVAEVFDAKSGKYLGVARESIQIPGRHDHGYSEPPQAWIINDFDKVRGPDKRR